MAIENDKLKQVTLSFSKLLERAQRLLVTTQKTGIYFLKFTSRAMILPVHGVNDAWKDGNHLGNKQGNKKSRGVALGTTLVSMSAIISALTYVFALPLALNLALSSMLPQLASIAPALVKFINPIFKASISLTSNTSNIFMMPTLSPALQAIKSIFPFQKRHTKTD